MEGGAVGNLSFWVVAVVEHGHGHAGIEPHRTIEPNRPVRLSEKIRELVFDGRSLFLIAPLAHDTPHHNFAMLKQIAFAHLRAPDAGCKHENSSCGSGHNQIPSSHAGKRGCSCPVLIQIYSYDGNNRSERKGDNHLNQVLLFARRICRGAGKAASAAYCALGEYAGAAPEEPSTFAAYVKFDGV